jgi:hypothetical protein
MVGSNDTRGPYGVLRRLEAFIWIIIAPSEARNGTSSKVVTIIVSAISYLFLSRDSTIMNR